MPFKVTMLLADAAQVADGKLYIIGGGWTVIGTEPATTAIALYIQVPWDQTNTQHHWRLELVDSDGTPFEVPTPMGDQPLVLSGALEVGRPVGAVPGTPLSVPLAITLGPLPFQPATRYEWRLTINEESEEDWRLAFSTRPGAPAPPATG